ncbi:hypothetical protein PAPHI01_0451 [Pancytospora philotis]|nr:hypothetical protein PAPHI01_0451 [Pancytospora philotis]
MMLGILQMPAFASAASPAAAECRNPQPPAVYDSILRDISPIKDLIVGFNACDRNTLLNMYTRFQDFKRPSEPNLGAYCKDYMVKELVLNTLRSKTPFHDIEQTQGLAKYYVIAESIRLVCKERSSEVYIDLAAGDEAHLLNGVDELLGELDALKLSRCACAPRDFLNTKGRSPTAYDIIVYVLSERHKGAEAVRERFYELLKAVYESQYSRCYINAQKFILAINELEKTSAIAGLELYNFGDIVLEFFTSKSDRAAFDMLDDIELKRGTAPRVIEYISSGRHARVSPYFVLHYIPHIQNKLRERYDWKVKRLLEYFLEPLITDVRLMVLYESPAILKYMSTGLLAHLLLTGFACTDFKIDVPRLAGLIAQEVEQPRLIYILLVVKERGEPGHLDALLSHFPAEVRVAWEENRVWCSAYDSSAVSKSAQ